MTEDKKHKHLVTFQPSGNSGYAEEGKTIREISLELGIALESICGGRGVCGKCKVQIEAGTKNLSPLTDSERKFLTEQQESEGYRLACQARIHGDVVVFVPEESQVRKQVVRKAATERAINLNSAVKKYYVEMRPASLEDPQADWERLQAELKQSFSLGNLTIDYQTLLSLQEAIRYGDWKITVTVWMDGEVIKIEPGFVEKGYGLAVDIGTTTMAGYLCDLSNGEVLATDSMMNPQVIYGEDVMSRISYVMTNGHGLEQLNQAVIKAINQIGGRHFRLALSERTSLTWLSLVIRACIISSCQSIPPV